jgi:ketosteroid isomerase-like protein
MSEENVEMVRRAYETFGEGGPEAVFDKFWSDDIVFDASPAKIPGLGIYRGRDEVRRLFDEDWFGAFPFEEWEVVVEELIDNGDQVIGMTRQRGRGATSGAAAELELAQICTVRGGKIVRVDTYLDRAEALEAAGLSE